jgi:signal transduction histidine kinase
VARHAAATRVSVALREEPDGVVLTVADDGRGIKPEEQQARTSLGLLGLRERASLVGGSAVLEGAPGRGTTATGRDPLRR